MSLRSCKFGTQALAQLDQNGLSTGRNPGKKEEKKEKLWQFPWEELLHASLVGLSGGLRLISSYNSALHKWNGI